MDNLSSRLSWFGLLLVTWMILFAKLDVFIFVSGIFFCTFAIYYNEKYLLKQDLSEVYPLNLWALFKYFCFLLYEIYISGFDTIKMIMKGDVNPTVVEIQTELTKPYLRAMLANSITLTPGKVTLDLEGQKLVVLWINPSGEKSKDYQKIIKGDLEKQLLKGENS